VYEDLIKKVQAQIDAGIGDTGRLQFILESLQKGKPLFKCDQKYVEAQISRQPKKKTTTNLSDHSTNSGQANITALFLNKSEMVPQPDLQKTFLEIRKDLEHALERLEKLERQFQEKSKFDLIEPEVDQNSLSKELHDITTEKQKVNDTQVKFYGKNKTKPKMDKNLHTIFKVLLVITILIAVSTFTVLWLFGTLEGKIKWQDYGISYGDASAIAHWLVFAIVLDVVAWPALGIATLISNERRKLQQ